MNNILEINFIMKLFLDTKKRRPLADLFFRITIEKTMIIKLLIDVLKYIILFLKMNIYIIQSNAEKL